MLRRVLCALILLTLAACASVSTYDAQRGQELSQQQRLDLQEWTIRGRLLIKSDEVLTANIQWRHNGHQDKLKLSGALGMGALLIALDEYGIELDTGDGVKQYSTDVDNFIARQIGFVVPITALRRWVLGAYLQGVPVLHLENGFQQLGWRIVYHEYMQTSAGVLPRRVKITKDHIKLKLIIDQWEIE